MINISFAQIRRLGYRLVAGRSVDITKVATKRTLLAPAEVAVSPPSYYLEGDLDRITNLAPTRVWAAEERHIRGGEIEHAATIAYTLEDVHLDDAYLYCGAAKMLAGWEKNCLPQDNEYRHFDTAHLASSWPATHYFGHFIWDTFPLEMLPGPEADKVALCMMPYSHAETYRTLLHHPSPPVVRRGHVRNLTIYSDFGQNSFKAMRYRVLRERMRTALSPPLSPGNGVFIRRGSAGEPRCLINGDAVEKALREIGFDIVDPDWDDATEILRKLNGAKIVVSVEGSQFSHALYTIADDGVFIVLQPPDRFSMSYKEFTDSLDMKFAFLVGYPADGGFKIDLDDLYTLLNKFA